MIDSRNALRAVTVLCSLALFATAARSQVVINEFSYDERGADAGEREYVELYNAGDTEVDLEGWFLTTGDNVGPGPEYDLPEGSSIEPGGFFVLGSLGVPNVDAELEAAPGREDLFGDGTSAGQSSYIILRDSDADVADAVAYERNKGNGNFPDDATLEGGIWGNYQLVAASLLSWQRWFDGEDTDLNGADFGHLPWTPGESNDRGSPSDYESDFEDGLPEDRLAEFPGSFVPGLIVDPLATTPSHPNTIPESPSGGLALLVWDPAGGGNYVALDVQPASDMMFEAWVYLDATPTGFTADGSQEIETWSIGLRGTSGTFYNHPVLFEANGNTGVTWTYQVTPAGATLYLIDEGFGRPAVARVHLGSIEIIPEENDGWQRLRLEVEGDEVVGYFGGTYGSTSDGEKIEGTVETSSIGNFYIGYREFLVDNGTVRPPTLDDLVVGPIRDAPAGPRFQRGDANADGGTNVTDAVFVLNFLFSGGEDPPCIKAGDSNDDGGLNLADAVQLLNHLFGAGTNPSSPFPDCGTDPTPDELSCEAFPPCE